MLHCKQGPGCNSVSLHAEAATYTVWLNYEQQGRPPRLAKSDDRPVVMSGPADRLVRASCCDALHCGHTAMATPSCGLCKICADDVMCSIGRTPQRQVLLGEPSKCLTWTPAPSTACSHRPSTRHAILGTLTLMRISGVRNFPLAFSYL